MDNIEALKNLIANAICNSSDFESCEKCPYCELVYNASEDWYEEECNLNHETELEDKLPEAVRTLKFIVEGDSTE